MSAIVVKDHGLQESTPQTRRFEGHETRQAPISKLPEDVLLIIFMMLRDWDWRSRTMVTRITHVCQEWRYIAIGAPLLWTKALFSYHAKWTILALQRALTAPIEVDIDFMESKGVIGVSKTLLGHISHTSKLDLFGTYDHLDEAQKLMAEDDATQLKELDIRCIQSRTVESPRPLCCHRQRSAVLSNYALSSYPMWTSTSIPFFFEISLRFGFNIYQPQLSPPGPSYWRCYAQCPFWKT